MNVSLTPKLEKYVNKQVEIGLYNSSSEVVRAALRTLINSESLLPINQDFENYKMWLNQEIQIGLDQAERGESIPGEKAIEDLRKFRKLQIKKHGL